MTLEEAKEFYFKYNGFSFHMDREEPAKSGSFRMLNLDKDTLRKWDEELLDHYFGRLWAEPEHTWVCHKTILEIVRRKNCDVNKCLGKLLREMEIFRFYEDTHHRRDQADPDGSGRQDE